MKVLDFCVLQNEAYSSDSNNEKGQILIKLDDVSTTENLNFNDQKAEALAQLVQSTTLTG